MPGQRHNQPTLDFVGSKLFECLGVNCHLHFWQNDQGLLCTTVITQGGTDTEKESAHKVNSGEENSPTIPAPI